MDFHRSRTIRETRKEHRCFGCLEMIPKGSQAQHDTGRIGSEFYSLYLCTPCVEYASKYDDYKDPLDGGYFEGHIGIARREREEVEEAASRVAEAAYWGKAEFAIPSGYIIGSRRQLARLEGEHE